MGISLFTFRLLILFFPGIICCYVIEIYTVHKEITQFKFLLNSFILGTSSYMIYWLLLKLINLLFKENFTITTFISFMTDTNHLISFKVLLFVSLIAIMLGLIITIIDNNKLHIKLAHKLKLTYKFGEQDVWGYTLNSKDIGWVTIRDLKNNLMYNGWVLSYSDNMNNPEILLSDVEVYNNTTGDLFYVINTLYLTLDKSNIYLEIYNKKEKESNNVKE